MKKHKEDVEETQFEEVERDLYMSILQQFGFLIFYFLKKKTL